VTLANRANISFLCGLCQDPSLRPSFPSAGQPQNPSKARNSRCQENLPLHSKTLLDPSGSCYPIIALQYYNSRPRFPSSDLPILYFSHLNLLSPAPLRQYRISNPAWSSLVQCSHPELGMPADASL
jgi:hypothetical protein